MFITRKKLIFKKECYYEENTLQGIHQALVREAEATTDHRQILLRSHHALAPNHHRTLWNKDTIKIILTFTCVIMLRISECLLCCTTILRMYYDHICQYNVNK